MPAQNPSAACGAAPVVASNTRPNIFTEQQEQWLGDAMADSLEGDWKPVRDASLSAHLQAIADRLVATLPPTTIQFRVLLIDSSEVNGLSVAGGHIYITRKLASAAANDDELAGVIGHEIGHIASHQFAVETTRDLRRLLNITSVGDRADVYAKYQALMDARMRDKHPVNGDSDDKQDEADKVGIYATAAAGYRPDASAELWDRAFFVDGKTRGKMADFFGITKPNERRLRRLRELAATLPAGCGGTRGGAAKDFAQWRKAVVANQGGTEVVRSKAVSEVSLTPPLRMGLDQVRFSPDGQAILAQDESSIFVLSHEPFQLRCRIDADGALPANFSPDSQSVTFSTPGLHTEQWSAKQKKLEAAHELLSREKCYETKLSPDGRTVLCVNLNPETLLLGLSMLDTASSAVVWEKKAWSTASWGAAVSLVSAQQTGQNTNVVYAAYSTDNNTLLLGSGPTKIAIDLKSRTELKTGSGIQDGISGEYAFIGSDKLASPNSRDPKKSGLYSFPGGKLLKTLLLPPLPMRSVANAGSDLHILMYGSKQFDIGLSDLNASKFLMTLTSHSMDEYGGTLIAEAAAGGLNLLHLGDTDATKQQVTHLPLSPLASLSAVSASPDGRYIAISTRSRGGIWDAVTGKQFALMYGFTDASWSDEDTVYLDMAKVFKDERHVKQVSMKKRTANDLTYNVDEKVHMRYGRLTEWEKDEKKKTWTLRLHDPADNKTIWSRQFRDVHLDYTASYGRRDLLFSFALKSNTAKDAMKADDKLAAEALALKNKDAGRLIEVIDGKTGVDAGALVMEMPPNYSDMNGVNRAGDLLYVTGADDRTAVYSMATGKQVRQLFGYVMALDPDTGRVCTANRVGEAVVYDPGGMELVHFELHQPIRYALLREKATLLTVLTADQKLSTMSVEGRGAMPKVVEAAEASEVK